MLLSPARAQRFEDSATDAEFDALLRASDAAEQPALHPDQFRYLMLVMLPKSDMPVPVVATFGVDSYGEPALDGAWVYLAGQQATLARPRSDNFRRIYGEALGEHYRELRARSAEIVARRTRPLAA